jgi:hypothetical protein
MYKREKGINSDEEEWNYGMVYDKMKGYYSQTFFLDQESKLYTNVLYTSRPQTSISMHWNSGLSDKLSLSNVGHVLL